MSKEPPIPNTKKLTLLSIEGMDAAQIAYQQYVGPDAQVDLALMATIIKTYARVVQSAPAHSTPDPLPQGCREAFEAFAKQVGYYGPWNTSDVCPDWPLLSRNACWAWEAWQAAWSTRADPSPDTSLTEIAGLLEPIAERDWHGKWRIQKAIALAQKALTHADTAADYPVNLAAEIRQQIADFLASDLVSADTASDFLHKLESELESMKGITGPDPRNIRMGIAPSANPSEISVLNTVKLILFPYLDGQITTESAQKLMVELSPYLRATEPVAQGEASVIDNNFPMRDDCYKKFQAWLVTQGGNITQDNYEAWKAGYHNAPEPVSLKETARKVSFTYDFSEDTTAETAVQIVLDAAGVKYHD